MKYNIRSEKVTSVGTVQMLEGSGYVGFLAALSFGDQFFLLSWGEVALYC